MSANISDLDLRLLKVFVAVAEAKGLSGAQAVLNVGQSTISIHLATLEARVGFRLCERGRSGFRLTPRGEKFLAAARTLLGNVAKFAKEVRSMDKTLVGELRIGLIDHPPGRLLTGLSGGIARFRERDEAVTFSLAVRPPPQLEELLTRGELDVVFSYFWRRLPKTDYFPLFSERQIACCGFGHPLRARAGRVSAEDAAAHEWTWRSYPLPNGIVMNSGETVTAVADDMEAVAVLIMSGKYLGYLPAEFAEPYIRRKLLVPINSNVLVYDVNFEMAYRRRSIDNDVFSAFLQDLQVSYGTRLPEPA